jgi:hypothetical protein
MDACHASFRAADINHEEKMVFVFFIDIPPEADEHIPLVGARRVMVRQALVTTAHCVICFSCKKNRGHALMEMMKIN